MSPEAIAIARRRVDIMLAERSKSLARVCRDKREEFGMHNALHSSGFVLTIHGVCSEELDARAQSAWEIIRSIVDSEGWFPADDNLQQFNDLLTEALTTQSADVDQVYDEAASLIKGNWPTLEEARDLALQKATADAEIDRLGATSAASRSTTRPSPRELPRSSMRTRRRSRRSTR